MRDCWIPAEPQLSAWARRLVREVLGEDHPRRDDAELVVAELTTNAVRYGAPAPACVYVSVTAHVSGDGDAGGVVVVVANNPAPPGWRCRPHGDERGRGMQIVAALAAGHGRHRAAGMTVAWATLTRHP